MKFFSLLLLLVFLSLGGFSTNYYSDPQNGSMNNNGTNYSYPWASLSQIFLNNKTFNSGDTIFLKNGNHGIVSIEGVNSSEVVITKAVGHAPVIEKLYVGFYSPAKNWRFDEVIFRKENTSTFSNFLVELGKFSSDITIDKCKVVSANNTSSWTRADWRNKTNHGIRARGSNHVITRNHITNVGIGISLEATNTWFEENKIQYFTIDGIRINADYCRVLRNQILDNITVHTYSENHADGIQLFSLGTQGVGSGLLKGVQIQNNIIVNMTSLQRNFKGIMQGIGAFDGMYQHIAVENNVICVDSWHGVSFRGALQCKIINNTIVDPYPYSFYDVLENSLPNTNVGPNIIFIKNHKTDNSVNSGLPSSGNVIANNIVSDYVAEQNGGTVSNNTLIDPNVYANYFVDVSDYDFHLHHNSPAIGQANSSIAPDYDLDGLIRGSNSGADNGAYEFTCNAIKLSAGASRNNICFGDTVTLKGKSFGIAHFNWEDGFANNQQVNLYQGGWFSLKATSNKCLIKDSVFINVAPQIPFPVIKTQGNNVLYTDVSEDNYQWYRNNVPVVGATDSSFVPKDNATYRVEVGNYLGCSKISSGYVFSGCNLYIEAKATKVKLCQGESTVLSHFMNGSVDSYFWEGAVSPGQAFFPDSSKYYVVHGTNQLGCEIVDSILVEVDDFSIPTVQLKDSFLISTVKGVQHRWYKNGVYQTMTTDSFYDPTTPGNYKVEVISAFGCTYTTSNFYFNGCDLFVKGFVSSKSICQGDSVKFQAVASEPGVSFIWTNGVQNNGYFTPSQTTQFVVFAQASQTCIATDTIRIEVNEGVVPIVQQNGLELFVSDTNLVSYQWYRNGAALTGRIDSICKIYWPGDYHVSGINKYGCEVVSPSYYHDMCAGNITGSVSGNAICAGDSVIFAYQASAGMASVSWSDGVVVGLPYYPTVSSEYYVEGIDGNGCVFIDTLKVNVQHMNKPGITAVNDTLFTSPGAYEYKWYLNNQIITGADAFYHKPFATGHYRVEVISQLGCNSFSDYEYYVFVVGNKELKEERVFGVYPNPGKDRLFVKGLSEQKVSVNIISVTGEVVCQKECSINDNEIEVQEIVSGIYYVVSLVSGERKVIKWVKY